MRKISFVMFAAVPPHISILVNNCGMLFMEQPVPYKSPGRLSRDSASRVPGSGCVIDTLVTVGITTENKEVVSGAPDPGFFCPGDY